MSQVVLGQMGHLGPGTDDTHTPCREQPGMSQVVLRQMGHLGPGTDDAPTHHVGNNLGYPRLSWDRWDISDLGLMMLRKPCWEQPRMSQVVLGQMGHLGPGTDDAPTHHVGNNLGCPRLSWDRWDISYLGLMMLPHTMLGTTSDVPGCPRLYQGQLQMS